MVRGGREGEGRERCNAHRLLELLIDCISVYHLLRVTLGH